MNPNINNGNCPTCCANRREDLRIVDEGDNADTYCDDPWHTPLPAAPAHDAVRSATERVVNAWRRMDAHGSDAELRRAVDALYEAWTDAAERAQGEKGGDRG